MLQKYFIYFKYKAVHIPTYIIYHSYFFLQKINRVYFYIKIKGNQELNIKD